MSTIYNNYYTLAQKAIAERVNDASVAPAIYSGQIYGPQNYYALMIAAGYLGVAPKEDLVLKHPDSAVVGMYEEHADRIDVDAVRELVAQAATTPAIAPRRVMLILNAERLTQAASNVLLKALEEHRDHVRWILTTASMDRLLGTVRSRCEVRSVPVWIASNSSLPPFFQLAVDAEQRGDVAQAVLSSQLFWRQWILGRADRASLKQSLALWEECEDSQYTPWSMHLDLGIVELERGMATDQHAVRVVGKQLDFLRQLRHTMYNHANTTLIFELVLCNMHTQ